MNFYHHQMNETAHPICLIYADGHKFCRKFCNMCGLPAGSPPPSTRSANQPRLPVFYVCIFLKLFYSFYINHCLCLCLCLWLSLPLSLSLSLSLCLSYSFLPPPPTSAIAQWRCIASHSVMTNPSTAAPRLAFPVSIILKLCIFIN